MEHRESFPTDWELGDALVQACESVAAQLRALDGGCKPTHVASGRFTTPQQCRNCPLRDAMSQAIREHHGIPHHIPTRASLIKAGLFTPIGE